MSLPKQIFNPKTSKAMTQKIKLSAGFLLVVSILIHVFELGVSYSVVTEFVGNYVTNPAIAIFFSVIALLIIVVGFRLFVELSFLPYPNQAGLQAVIVFLACLFGLASAILTTVGAGKVATTNLELAALPSPTPEYATWQTQLAADNERMTALNRIQQRRKGGWMTDQESAEMAILQKRIEANTKRIAQESEQLRQLTANVQAENDAALSAHQTAHTSFGFMTQILLVVCVGIRYYLKRMLHSGVEIAETSAPDPGQESRDYTSPDRQQQIFELHKKGLNGSQIAHSLNVNKSTVSRALRKKQAVG